MTIISAFKKITKKTSLVLARIKQVCLQYLLEVLKMILKMYVFGKLLFNIFF